MEAAIQSPSRILGVSCGPPFAASTWSGSSLGLFGALRSLGYIEDAYAAESSKAQIWIARALAFSANRSRWRDRNRTSVWPARFQARTARRRFEAYRQHDYDAVLQLGPYLMRGEKPTFSYHDDELSAAVGLGRATERDARARLGFEGPYYRSMDRIFTMSAWAADVLAASHGIARDRIDAVGAGSNIGEYLLTGQRDYTTPNFLFVGRDFERKGGPDVLRAFEQVRKNLPSARLTIVGFGNAGTIAEGVESLGLVPLGGEAGKERMAAIYRSASTFVMPSAYEPFGIAFLEAQAAGLACIGTDRCAMPEIIGDCGATVPSGDVAALARAMYAIGSDAEGSKELGERARRRYFERYGWERVARRVGHSIDAICRGD